MRKSTHNIVQALFFVLLASLGPSLGCVDLTQPWKKGGFGEDARGDLADVGSGGGPGNTDSGYPIGPDGADADHLSTEHPPDAEPPAQQDDGGPVDTFPATSDGDPIVNFPDASPVDLADASRDSNKADANTDADMQPLDGRYDPPAPDSRKEDTDGPQKEDLNTDLILSVPDSSLADAPIDALGPPPDAEPEAPTISGLLASYPCESANGTVLPDISGNGKNGTLANGSGSSTPIGFSFATGMVGKALTLSASDKAYVSLPRGILAQLSQVTIATWVKLNSGTDFQRIFDIGVDTNTFMYLTNSGGSGVRFRITSTPLKKNQVVEGAMAMPVGRWTHIALTLGDNGVSIYLDGAQVAQQGPAALRPSDLGETGNNFIGRSPFTGDPYLDGQVDEFRIYDRVLSPAEIGELASGQ